MTSLNNETPKESEDYLRGREDALKELIQYGLVNYSIPEDVYFFRDQWGYEHDVRFRIAPKRKNYGTISKSGE